MTSDYITYSSPKRQTAVAISVQPITESDKFVEIMRQLSCWGDRPRNGQAI